MSAVAAFVLIILYDVIKYCFLYKHQLTDQSGFIFIIYTVPPNDLKLGSINIPDFILSTLHSARKLFSRSNY